MNPRKKFSDLARGYFEHEHYWHFAVEAFLFAIITIISTWPIVAAADAVNQLLQRT